MPTLAWIASAFQCYQLCVHEGFYTFLKIQSLGWYYSLLFVACVFEYTSKYDQDTVNFTVFVLKFKALYYGWPEKKDYFISKYTFATGVGKLNP